MFSGTSMYAGGRGGRGPVRQRHQFGAGRQHVGRDLRKPRLHQQFQHHIRRGHRRRHFLSHTKFTVRRRLDAFRLESVRRRHVHRRRHAEDHQLGGPGQGQPHDCGRDARPRRLAGPAGPALSGGGVITNSGSGETYVDLSQGTRIPQTSSRPDGNGSGKVALVLADTGAGSLLLSGSDTFTGGTTVLPATRLSAATSCPRARASSWAAARPSLSMRCSESVSPAAATPVPEPGTIVLLLAALWSAAIYCRFSPRSFSPRWKTSPK